MNWTHFVDFDFDVDVRDGVSRSVTSNALTYSDGDMIRIPDANGTVYVVVFVTPMGLGTERQYKRAYLMRHDANWGGSGWQ